MEKKKRKKGKKGGVERNAWKKRWFFSASSFLVLFSLLLLLLPPHLPFLPSFLSSKEEAPCTTTAVVWRHVTSNGVVIHRNRENPAPLFLEASLDTSRKNTRASHASGKPLYNGSRSWFLRLLVKCTRFEPIPLLLAREKFVSRKPPRSGRDFESWNFAK